ncbi:14087_t:CDS:2, partial [Dentiscutata erythropus]
RSLSQPDINPPAIPARPRYRFYQNQQTPPRIDTSIFPLRNPNFPRIRQGNISPVSSTFSQTRVADFEETLSSPRSANTVRSDDANNNTEYRSIFEPTDDETTYRPLGQRNYLEDHDRIIIATSEPEADNQSILTQDVNEVIEEGNQGEGFPLDNINNFLNILNNENNNLNNNPVDNNLIDLGPPDDQENISDHEHDTSDEGSEHSSGSSLDDEDNSEEEMSAILNAMGAYLKKGARDWYLGWAADNDGHDWTALRRAFENKFCNDDFRDQWLEELRGLKQRKTESVEEYYYQVMRMATRATLDAARTLPYFIKGLLPEIRAVVKTHAPANLNAALLKAKQYEQGKGEVKRRKKKTKHYESSSDESDSSEKKKPQQQPSQQYQILNRRNVSYVEYDNHDIEEHEAYEAMRNKPNNRPSPIRKPGRPPKMTTTPNPPLPKVQVQEPEVLVDFEQDPYEEEPMEEVKPTEVKPAKKPRMKRQPSIIDQMTPYDISQDILNMQASAKIGQLLKYPDQKKNMSKILKRPTQKETNHDLYSNPWQDRDTKILDTKESENSDDENPAIYLTETAAVKTSEFQVGILDESQEKSADKLFTEFTDVKAQLKLNKDKCQFFSTSIKFLGHEISRQGIQPDEGNLIKVKEYPQPTNLRTIRGFLGLASYYRKFIKDFSTKAKPLNKLLQKDTPFQWEAEQQQAFEWLKVKLTSAPVLRYPDFKKPFYLHTDASGTGLGAVLAQKDPDKREYAVAFASRSLNQAERNYSTTEQECLAVIWAVEHFKHYFGTTHFYVVTDHAALKWLHTTELKGRRARWILRLEPYNFTILYRAGKSHNNADSLSQLEI